jgi:DNA-binding XRE family transcriptional regulator
MYLNDAMNNLGDMFDYAINDLGYDAEEFFTYFIISKVAFAFERGNPSFIAGLSGPELASEVIFRTFKNRPDTSPSEDIDKSAEFWAGWVLAYYQWHTANRFEYMQKNGLNIKRVLSLYPTLHEADITKFTTIADQIIKKNSVSGICNLQRIRKACGMTQSKLAEKSGASLRMIRLYERRGKDIKKAQANTLARIARVLDCTIEDLLEV